MKALSRYRQTHPQPASRWRPARKATALPEVPEVAEPGAASAEREVERQAGLVAQEALAAAAAHPWVQTEGLKEHQT